MVLSISTLVAAEAEDLEIVFDGYKCCMLVRYAAKTCVCALWHMDEAIDASLTWSKHCFSSLKLVYSTVGPSIVS